MPAGVRAALERIGVLTAQQEVAGPVRFGTFTGVFTPTLLTILGVIMYVRIGWVVGNAGLAGAWLIMLLAMGITTCTGLSLSSIATNTRIGPGGPYAIISKSLGLEVGGAIGVPLYLTRPLGVAMYVIGFREGWLWVFPTHHALLVDGIVLLLLFAISWRSANLAFKTQYLIMAVIALSLVGIFLNPAAWSGHHDVDWWGEYPGFVEDGFRGGDFWIVFAVFFPATTGILAGANMSGDLKNPRRAIPRGTLSAIALSSVIYFVVAWWAARSGTTKELTSNYTVLIDGSVAGPLVLAGLLGATFSSALAGMVGGPRILMAMGEHRIVPGGEWVARTGQDGEPRNALLLTFLLTAAAVMVRDLNTIAPLVTMFFLITYCVLNVVVLVEGSLGLVSFRPTLRTPMIVPLCGLVGCVFAMFIVNPTFGLLSVAVVLMVYLTILRRKMTRNGEDVRSSIFVALAEWAASRVTDAEAKNVRAWKPNLLVPLEDPDEIRGEYLLLSELARPEGSVKLLGLARQGRADELEQGVVELAEGFRRQGLFCSWGVISQKGFVQAISAGIMALQSAFFRPNILVLTVPRVEERMEDLRELIGVAEHRRLGVLLVSIHPRAGIGQKRRVLLWVRPAPGSWAPHDAFDAGSLNLILLMGYRVWRSWKAELTLVTAIEDPADRPKAERFLEELCDLARFPSKVHRHVEVGAFDECLRSVPVGDLSIIGLEPKPTQERLHQIVTDVRSTCIFVKDSGLESARA